MVFMFWYLNSVCQTQVVQFADSEYCIPANGTSLLVRTLSNMPRCFFCVMDTMFVRCMLSETVFCRLRKSCQMTSRQCTDLCQIKLRKFAIHNSVPGFVFFFPNFFTVQLAGYCMDQSDLFGIILSLPQAGAIQLLGYNLSRGLQEFQCCFQKKDVTWLSLVF